MVGKDRAIGLDRALLRLKIPEWQVGEVSLYAQATECYRCRPFHICSLKQTHTSVLVNSTFPTILQLRWHNGSSLCRQLPHHLSSIHPTPFISVSHFRQIHFGEHGQYQLHSGDGLDGDGDCRIVQTQAPINSFLRQY